MTPSKFDDYVSLEIGANGRTVMVEPETHPGLVRRVFRRCTNGALEYATLADWRAHGDRARFYGYASRELPDTMTRA